MAIYQSKYTGKQIDDAIANQAVLAEKIEDAVENQKAMAEQIEKNHQIAIRNSKQIENLKQGSADQFETDSSVAYVKNVPENALPYAEVKKIGGMTRKCTNLIPYPYISGNGTSDGVTYRINNDASISFSGNKTDTSTNVVFQLVHFVLPAGIYRLSGLKAAGGYDTIHIGCDIYDMDGTWVNIVYDNGSGGTITLERKMRVQIFIRIYSSYTGSVNFTVYPMLNAGTTALPYEPYFEGLRSAPTEEVESVGANILNGEVFADSVVAVGGKKDTTNGTVFAEGWRFENNPVLFSNFKPNTQYTFIIKSSISQVGDASLVIKYTDGTTSNFGIDEVNKPITRTIATRADKSVSALEGSWKSDTTFYYNECGIFEGVLTEADFKPYTCNTLPIPEAVQALDGYGLGINDEVYNYVDWEKKQFVKRVGCVDMGTLDWSLNYTGFNGNLSDVKTPNYAEKPNILALSYEVVGGIDAGDLPAMADKAITINYTLPILYVKDSTYTDAATFKAAMSGVMLVYELAEPITEDISDLISSDNLIGVEGGGTLTFKNEYEYAVPSEVEYQVEV